MKEQNQKRNKKRNKNERNKKNREEKILFDAKERFLLSMSPDW